MNHKSAKMVPVAYPMHGGMIGRQEQNGPSGSGFGEETDPSYTLTAGGQVRHGVAVVQPVAFTTEQTPKFSRDAALTLTQGSPSGGGHPQCVMQPVNFYGGNKRADRPEGGFYVKAEETSKTLDAASGLNPTCSQGGTAVLQPVAFEPGSIARNAGPSGESALAPTLRKEMGDNQPAVRIDMQVRRLTPVECSRLQGFPDDYLELTYADADEAHSAQVLHELWREAGTPAIEKQGWRTGISSALLSPKILLAGVYGGWLSWEMAERCAAARGALPGEDYCHEDFMLALREAGKARRSPYKRESFGQLARKLGGGLSILPLESAQARKVLRSSRLWPEAQAKWPLRYALAKGKAREALDRMNPDGPRYKALGNSMAVPVMRWIGERIQQVSDL